MEKIIDLLDDSLMWVLKSRCDSGYGLVTGAYTADWGMSSLKTFQEPVFQKKHTGHVIFMIIQSFSRHEGNFP